MNAKMEWSQQKISGAQNKDISQGMDLNAIQETAYLLPIRGMQESIKAGMTQPPQDLAKSLDW